jgi:hypothetical protein
MQLKDVAPSYGVALTIAIAVYFLKFLPISYWFVLPLQIVLGLVVFFVICEASKLQEYIEVKSIARDYIGKLLKRK